MRKYNVPFCSTAARHPPLPQSRLQLQFPPHPAVGDAYDHSHLPVLLLVVFTSPPALHWLHDTQLPYVVIECCGDGPYSLPRNRGYEAARFLKYVVDHYCTLPERLVLLHGNLKEWHIRVPVPEQPSGILSLDTPHSIEYNPVSILDILSHIDFSAYDYMSLNTGHCFADKFHNDIVPFWERTGLTKLFPLYNQTNHVTKTYTCCAQFVVSRDRIWSIPHEVWKTLYEEILKEEDMQKSKQEAVGMEYGWARLFGEGLDPNPATWQCMFPSLVSEDITEERFHEQQDVKNQKYWREWHVSHFLPTCHFRITGNFPKFHLPVKAKYW